MRSSLALLIGLVGCGSPGPEVPDLEHVEIETVWTADDASRLIQVRLAEPQIVCVGTERSLLLERPVRCTSTPWEVLVDGVPIEVTPVVCEAEHDGILGRVPQRCEGGSSSWVPLPDGESEHIEVTARAGDSERSWVLPDARAVHALVPDETVAAAPDGAIAWVEIELVCGERFDALLTPLGGGESVAASAEAVWLWGCESRRLALFAEGPLSGEYAARVFARAVISGAEVAVLVEGTLAFAER